MPTRNSYLTQLLSPLKWSTVKDVFTTMRPHVKDVEWASGINFWAELAALDAKILGSEVKHEHAGSSPVAGQ